jgi:hypothetical protein
MLRRHPAPRLSWGPVSWPFVLRASGLAQDFGPQDFGPKTGPRNGSWSISEAGGYSPSVSSGLGKCGEMPLGDTILVDAPMPSRVP